MTQEEINFFDSIAPQWDAMEVKSLPDKINEILDIINVPRGSKILDLGTGTGILLPYLAERTGETGEVTGVDFSDGMLNEARRKFGDLENVKIIKADFETDNIEGEFDLIILYCVYPHLNEPIETLRWLQKINCKQDGRIIIAFPNDEVFVNHIHGEKKAPSDCLPSAPQLADTLRSYGFQARALAYSPEIYIVEITQNLKICAL